MKFLKRKMNLQCLLPLAMVAFFLVTLAPGQVIVTPVGGYVGDGGPATQAALVWPEYAVYDAQGNLFVSDRMHHRIRKIDHASGIITTVAGTGVAAFGGDGGPASSAAVNGPNEIVFDSTGNLLVADCGNNRIRKIDPAGIITTIAGSGAAGYSGDGGPALEATMRCPWAVALDAQGNLFLSDISNNVVRKIDSSGIITTVAGNGVQGYNGDGIAATSASLNYPRGVLLDGAGNFYIADTNNHRVRKVDASGIINTVAGTGLGGFSGDDGPAIEARIAGPRGLAFDLFGNLLISNAGRSRVRRVDRNSQIITTVVGSSMGFNGDGLGALETMFGAITGILPDSSGGMLVADNGNGRVRGIDASGVVTTVAGGFIGDGRPATSASVNLSEGLVLDAAGNLYLADTYNYRVRKVDRWGIITTFAGNGMTGYSGDGGPATLANLAFPYGVAVDKAGNVFFTEEWSASIRRVDRWGTITTFFQDPNYYFDLTTLVMDANSNLYVADSGNCVVRKIDSFAVATIVAGTEFMCGYSGDGGPATQAQLSYIYGVAVDGAGNLYIADADNNRIRRVDAAGVITTIAGNGNCDFTGDGGAATAAALCYPYSVAADSGGNLYIADYTNGRVRQVDRTGIIRTIAGNGGGYSWDGGPPVHAGLDSMEAVATDNVGNVYVAEFGRVRKIAFPRSLYLHAGDQGLSLNYTSPSDWEAEFRDSGPLGFRGGNPWRALGTWDASRTLVRGTLYELKDLHVWLGVEDKQDRKANFDLRAEVRKNGKLVAWGETRCISGLKEDGSRALEVTVSFAPFNPVNWDGTKDVLSLRLLGRMGTTADGSACGGRATAFGLELYFDGIKRPSQFPATIP